MWAGEEGTVCVCVCVCARCNLAAHHDRNSPVSYVCRKFISKQCLLYECTLICNIVCLNSQKTIRAYWRNYFEQVESVEKRAKTNIHISFPIVD